MQRTKRNARAKQLKPVSAQDALAMLESAIAYCQAAGIQVDAANGDNGTLGLFIHGAHYVLTGNGTRAALRLGNSGTASSVLIDPATNAAVIGTPKGN